MSNAFTSSHYYAFLMMLCFFHTSFLVIAAGGKDGMQRVGLWPQAGWDGRLEPEFGHCPWRLALASGPQQEWRPLPFLSLSLYKLQVQ
jgi:hypothetical protein